MSDVNALLDMQLDDLQDMPEFAPFPNGAHVATIKFEHKEINSKPAIELTLTAVETQELENPAEDKPLVAGATTNILFMLDNEYGQGSLKEVLKPLATATGIGNVGQLFEAVNNMQALVVTKVRHDKKRDQNFTSIKSIALI